MLFSFNYFWKSVFAVGGSWSFYLLFGYEFTIITLLTFLILVNVKKNN